VLCAVAFVAGAINSVAGGGTFLTFPALIFAGVPPIGANATNNFAMWFGTLGSARGYREEVREFRHLLVRASAVSVVGSLCGAVLLLRTPPRIFEHLIPYLLLFATALFALSPYLARPHPERTQHFSAAQLVAQFFSSLYGGYFGAGQGFMMLAILAFSGLPNLNAMNAVKNVLAVVINGVALVPFVLAGVIRWPQAVVMAVAALAGGYAGSRLFRRIPPAYSRAFVIALGAGMSAYFLTRA